MNNINLSKTAIQEDIETLKTLDVDIMPADVFYKANARLYLFVFLKLWGTIVLGFFLPLVWFWRELHTASQWFELISCLAGLSLMALGGVIFIMVMIGRSLTHYILLKHQIAPKLKTGEFLVEKMHLTGKVAFRIFVLIVLIPSLFLPPGASLFTALAGFFISGLLTSMLVEMELDRIGISVLFTLVKQFFEKDKKCFPKYAPKK